MKTVTTVALLLGLPSLALAETTQIDVSKLPSTTVYDVAELTPLAMSASGSPAVVLLSLDAGDVVPPHAAKSGLRLLTVISGDMSWGDGPVIDQMQERVYGPGSLLTLPAGVDHWLAARDGALTLQLIILDDETPVSAIQEQMK